MPHAVRRPTATARIAMLGVVATELSVPAQNGMPRESSAQPLRSPSSTSRHLPAGSPVYMLSLLSPQQTWTPSSSRRQTVSRAAARVCCGNTQPPEKQAPAPDAQLVPSVTGVDPHPVCGSQTSAVHSLSSLQVTPAQRVLAVHVSLQKF